MKRLLIIAVSAFLTVLFIVGATSISGESGFGQTTGGAAYLSAVLGDPAAAAAAWAGSGSSQANVQEQVSTESDLTALITSSDSAGSDEESSTPASTADPSTAVGSIITKFFSSDSANLTFGKIAMKNNTSKTIDLQSQLSSTLDLKMELGSDPEVLIVHTHATESYMLEERDFYTDSDASRSTNNAVNMVKIGDIITEKLQESGISVLHSTTQHDAVSYINSYNNAKATITKYLEQYPSIKVVIDVHRDAIASGDSDKVKTLCEVNGKNAAQVMLVMGCQDGSITNHPDWEQNLRLALRIQQASAIMYPGLMRPILLQPRCYNENMTKGSMLIEIGTDANTLSEAEYSAELVGDILSRVLKELK